LKKSRKHFVQAELMAAAALFSKRNAENRFLGLFQAKVDRERLYDREYRFTQKKWPGK